MGYPRVALLTLRYGVGLYLLFTAIARFYAPTGPTSIVTLFSALGVGGFEPGAFSVGLTIFIGLLGMLLLSGQLLGVTGLLVAILGLANGLAELFVSQTDTLATAAERHALLTLGLRDLLVLTATGIAISAFEVITRKRPPERPETVTWAPPEKVPVDVERR